MHRHFSCGTADLVALIAAHRAAREAPAAALAQAKVSRVRASLNAVRDGAGADTSGESGRGKALADGSCAWSRLP